MKIPEVFRIEVENSARNLSRLMDIFAGHNVGVEGLQTISKCQKKTLWELTVEIEEDSLDTIFEGLEKDPRIKVMGRSDRVFTRHRGGKIQVVSKVPIESQEELRDIYTPGVARVCLAIQKEPSLANTLTNKSKTVAIVTNGTAILGLGNIGAVAGLPVMEGKAALFHRFAGLSGVPILIENQDPQKIIDAIEAIAPSFGAIQLEDIRAPECFEIESELIERLNIPVLHDDQHGTAVVALAALLSATKAVGKNLKESVVGQVGLGTAGIGISRLLLAYGARQVLGTDLSEDALKRLESLGGKRANTLDELMRDADIVVATTGVKGLIKPETVRPGHLILALTNPEPEIEPEEAIARGACFAADGKSVNNVLGFPGLFKGVLDRKATKFEEHMLISAAQTIHKMAPEGQLVPNALNTEVHEAVAASVQQSAPGSEK